MKKSPYKFLDSYSKEDRDIFFGRDKETGELYSRVFESRILVVYGTSGTGKSSLIYCGLANRFNDSDWLPVTIRRGSDINLSFVDSLLRAGLKEVAPGRKKFSGSREDEIIKLIRSVYLDHFKPVYLIFDQFEELFIFGNSKEKDELINTIKKVLDSQLQCRFIFSVREEYLAGLTEFEKIIPSFLSNRIRIEKMTRQNASQVIEGPCRLNNIAIEPGFAESLLEKLNPDGAEVELTYLQVFLDKVFRMASGNGEEVSNLSTDLLKNAGEVKDLLGSFLEEQISQLENPESGMVILKSFVSVKGTKHQITEDEVVEYSKTFGKNTDRAEVRALIQKFIRLRILRDKDENNRYELRHDSLAAKIYENITLVEKELLEIRQFLDNAWNIHEKRQLYLSVEDLNYIAPFEDRLFLNDKLQGFIIQSKRLIQKARRRQQRILIFAAAGIIIILSFFSVWALREKSNALDQKLIADEQMHAAILSKEVADSAQKEAFASRNLAVEKESQAILARKQSDEARRLAVIERENALKQKSRAEELSITANLQARIATEEKLNAEQERAKAIIAEGQARKLSFLSIAQNMALRSSGMEKNPELMGLLAVQAFNFNRQNNGRTEDPIIYEALSKAFLTLDSSVHSVFTGSPNEIRILSCKENGMLLSADIDGNIRSWSPEGISTLIKTLPFHSPVNFIAPNSTGERIITQHDNNDLILWDIGKGDYKDTDNQKLSGDLSYTRAVAFSPGEKYLATAARDSSVIIWDISVKPSVRKRTARLDSGVRAIVFCGTDSLIMAREDGTLVVWNIVKETMTTLYSSSQDIPLCLTWSRTSNILCAGCSNGSLLVFDLHKGSSVQPSEYEVHTSGIDLITFNSDFTLLATSCWDKTIKFYNYHEFFELGNAVGGSEYIRNINSRIRSLIFTDDNKLAAGLSDKSIRIWETSSEKLASLICNQLTRNMTQEEWNSLVGEGIPYESTCHKNP
jgi:WD40 repeat protein